MTSLYLLFILSFTFINSLSSEIESNLTYISNPKKVGIERFYNVGSRQNLKRKLRSSLLPANITSQILNFNAKNNNMSYISYDEMKGDYKLNHYYGKVWTKGNLIFYEIFHSIIEASPKKFKEESIDCDKKWFTLWLKIYCYKKTNRVNKIPNDTEKGFIKEELKKESIKNIKSTYPKNSLNE